MPRPRSRATRATLAAIALVIGGCSSDAPTATSVPVTGTYVLQSVGGAAPPAVLYSFVDATTPGDSGTIYVVADTLQIIDGGTYRQDTWFVGRQNSVVFATQRWHDRGVWTRDGSTLHFDSEYVVGVTFQATLDGKGGLASTRDVLDDGHTTTYVLRRI